MCHQLLTSTKTYKFLRSSCKNVCPQTLIILETDEDGNPKLDKWQDRIYDNLARLIFIITYFIAEKEIIAEFSFFIEF